MGMEMREMAGQDNANAPLLSGHAVHVAQQMTQLGEDIQQLLRLAQDVGSRTRHVREQLAELRQSGAVAPAREAALLAELQAVQRELQRFGDDLLKAQTEAQRLQNELPTADFQDAQERLQRVEIERVRLEREIEPLEKALGQKQGEAALRSDSYGKRKSQKTAALKGPVQESALAADAGTEVPAEIPGQPGRLAPGAQKQLGQIVQLVNQVVSSGKKGPSGKGNAWSSTPISSMTATLQSRWSGFIAQMNVEGWMDVNQLIQWVMREAYLSNTEDLKFYAHRVKFFTDLKKMIREELTKARTFQSQHQKFSGENSTLDQAYPMVDFVNKPNVMPDGSLSPQVPTARGETKEGRVLEEYIKGLEQTLNSVGDDAQLAQLDLQTVTQKQQQTLQTLSNLSKVLHETSMAIIRKIGS